MPENLTVYEKAKTTDRPAERLARKHGFESVAQLAESLPQDAHVLDVGAGASPFGKEIATLRPDITWVNFDYSYQDPAILDEVSQETPPNVQYVAGDATKLDTTYGPASFDAVFSYWLLPHLSLDDPEPAKAAARAIFAVTKPGGLMSVGPKRMSPLKAAARIVKDETLDADSYADKIVASTELPKTKKYIQRLTNEVATPYFGTTRYTKRGERVSRLYDRESGNYINPLTRRGARIIGQLALAAARYAWRTRNSK